MSATRMLIALAVVSAISWLMHRYLWARLVRDAAWPQPWSRTLAISIFVLAALMPLTLLAMRWLPRAANAPLAWLVYTWMGLAFYLFLLTVITDAGRGIVALAGGLPKAPERRLLLARTLAVVVGALSALIGAGGVANVVRGFDLRHVRIPLAKLPKSATGYAIVQITDVHVGPTIGRDFVEAVVRETNKLGPDMVVITGDLVDGTVDQLRALVEPLRDLRARDG